MKQHVQNVERSITVWPLANHIIICATELFLLLPLQARSHTTHLPSFSVLYQTYAYSFDPSPLLLQRQSTGSPPEQLEYYDVAWRSHVGSSERDSFGCGQEIKASLLSGSAQFERRSYRHSEVSKLPVLWPHTLSVHELPTIATLAPSCLLSYS